MSHPALPRYISPERAALLTGRSRPAIVRLCAEGKLRSAGRVRRRIRLAELERFLGRPVTLGDWAASNDRYDRAREADALRNHRRHEAGTGPVDRDNPAIHHRDEQGALGRVTAAADHGENGRLDAPGRCAAG